MKRNNYTIIVVLLLICFPFFMSYGQGARYTGEYTKSPVISHYRKSNFVIEGLEISSTNTQSAITLDGCENVIIRNCKFGPMPLTRAIYLNNCKNITIIDCTFENVQSGIRVSTSQGIKFENNDVTNIVGKLKGSNSLGQMAQYINVSGAGNSISYNVVENFPGESDTEDIINLYNSNGTAQSPIIVKGNWIRGGGPSASGGGINLGDGYGSYQIAEDNIVVDPGQYGIGLAGGHDIILRNNKIYGKSQPFTNVGLGACNWYDTKGQSYNITVENNVINFRNKEGMVNSWWFYKNVEPIAGKETNRYDPYLTANILPEQIIGRARAGMPGEGSTPLPGEVEPKDEEPKDEEPTNPEFNLPDINNHPSITIYLDQFNRACINISGRLTSPTVLIADSRGNLIFQNKLTRFHTVLPNDSVPGSYYVYVKNGSYEHLKMLTIN
ncbi:MAG: right-handed parallel beta-helix repeat-containing protein [Fermentimonas sp.]|nr:right-handed parallel beta-helix repeat-containing protein [Fermentimonas sp.]